MMDRKNILLWMKGFYKNYGDRSLLIVIEVG